MSKFDNEATLIKETIEAVKGGKRPKVKVLETIEILLRRMEHTNKQKLGATEILEEYFKK